jgi:4'-phosphopantetheinyl transferase
MRLSIKRLTETDVTVTHDNGITSGGHGSTVRCAGRPCSAVSYLHSVTTAVERPAQPGEVNRRMNRRMIDMSPHRRPLVLLARPDEVLRVRGEHLLTPSERRRARALRHRADRDAHVAAHLLVRHCAAALTGRPPEDLELVQRCAECGSTQHGRPSIAGLPELHVSLAHTRGAVVAGADRQPIGVDVEGARPKSLDPTVLTYTLTAAEMARVRSASDPSAAFVRYWVRKECLVKAGAVTLDGLSRVELDHTTEQDAGGGCTRGRFGALHLVDWLDRTMDVAVAAAAWSPPVVASFRPTAPGPAT